MRLPFRIPHASGLLGWTLGAALSLSVAPVSAQVVDTRYWGTERDRLYGRTRPGTIYIGGDFTIVGPSTGAFVGISSAGQPLQPFPRVIGAVYATVSDGAGGWFIGGLFTHVAGVPRLEPRAHSGGREPRGVEPGVQATWSWRSHSTAEPSTPVGASRPSVAKRVQYLAALDASTGAATPLNPSPNVFVDGLALSGGLVYVGGEFTLIGGTARNYIAALDATTGTVADWNPNSNNYVYTLVVDGTTVYAAGIFTFIGGQPRTGLAALDAGSGGASAWTPDPDFRPMVVVPHGSTVYVGGSFTNIGG